MFKQPQKGFTLIELLVVIAIIGILASVVLASLNSARDKAKNAGYVAQIKEYQKALALYHLDNNSYPSTSNGSWGCLGTGHSGGDCWGTSYTEANAAVTRAALDPYIDTSVIPGPTGFSWSSIYHPIDGDRYHIILLLEGDVDCPVGVKTPSTSINNAGLTRCNVYNQGG